VRLFVAVELNKQIKDELAKAQHALREFDRLVRWSGGNQMHLTLKFLGEVPDSQVDDICTAVELAASESAGFELTLQGAGCFPPKGKVRVVWVGLAEESKALANCQRRVEDELSEIGFPPERRPFSPHLTLGRVRDDRSGGQLRTAVEALEVPSVSQAIDSVVLMRSELLPQGARYSQVGAWPLGGAAGGE